MSRLPPKSALLLVRVVFGGHRLSSHYRSIFLFCFVWLHTHLFYIPYLTIWHTFLFCPWLFMSLVVVFVLELCCMFLFGIVLYSLSKLSWITLYLCPALDSAFTLHPIADSQYETFQELSKFLQVQSQKPSSAMMKLALMRTATGMETPWVTSAAEDKFISYQPQPK